MSAPNTTAASVRDCKYGRITYLGGRRGCRYFKCPDIDNDIKVCPLSKKPLRIARRPEKQESVSSFGHALRAALLLPRSLHALCLCEILLPSRYCEASGSLVSDAVGVSFPIEDGIPSLVPKDGKFLEDDPGEIRTRAHP
uniref:Protein preY, mitochondrial n=1 Tax=Setaria viridis TaxID=4556 RepID=A0A4U6T9I1_SETVI|nr:hypothetical protein SEVIR_9G242700v2 [Setaria viridis]